MKKITVSILLGVCILFSFQSTEIIASDDVGAFQEKIESPEIKQS
ncbi:hypothetical protein [Cytobacillus firmus]